MNDPSRIILFIKQMWRTSGYFPQYVREYRDEKSWVRNLDTSFTDYAYHEWLTDEACKRMGPTKWDWERGKKIPNWKLFRDHGWIFDKPKKEESLLERFRINYLLEPVVKRMFNRED